MVLNQKKSGKAGKGGKNTEITHGAIVGMNNPTKRRTATTLARSTASQPANLARLTNPANATQFDEERHVNSGQHDNQNHLLNIVYPYCI